MKKIPLNQGKFAIIDDEDFAEISRFKWSLHTGGYAVRMARIAELTNCSSKRIYMHRFVNKTPKGLETDHINGNKLDNRRSNLRTCSHRDNQRNKPIYPRNNACGFKGVYVDHTCNRFVANIKVNGRTIYIGRFDTALQAHEAYKAAATRHHGEFARFK